jgi:hypothetical protein
MLSNLVTVRIWSFHLAKQRFCRCCDHSIHYVALMTRVQNDSSAVLRTPVLTHVQCTSSKRSIHLALRCHFSLRTGFYAGRDGTYCPSLKLDALLRRRAAPNRPLGWALCSAAACKNPGRCTWHHKAPQSAVARPPGGRALRSVAHRSSIRARWLTRSLPDARLYGCQTDAIRFPDTPFPGKPDRKPGDLKGL